MNDPLKEDLLKKESHDASRGASFIVLLTLGIATISIVLFPFMSPVREMIPGFHKSPIYYTLAILAISAFLYAIWYFLHKRMSLSDQQMLHQMVGKNDHSPKSVSAQPLSKSVYRALAIGVFFMLLISLLVFYIKVAYPELAQQASNIIQTPMP